MSFGLRDLEQFRERMRSLADLLCVQLEEQKPQPEPRWGSLGRLVERGVLSPEQLDAALAEAERRHVEPAALLLDERGVSVADVGEALSTFYGCPFLGSPGTCAADVDATKAIKSGYLKQHCWVPVRDHAGRPFVLIDNPHDVAKVDSVDRVLGPRHASFAVGLQREIVRLIEQAERPHATSAVAELLHSMKTEFSPDEADGPDVGVVDENDSSIIRLANQIIVDAEAARASDIHVEPSPTGGEMSIRFRVDGTCVEYQRLPHVLRHPLVARLKIMAQLDIAERRLPQDGKMRVRVGERTVELRMATLPTVGGNEDVVLRLLSRSERMKLDQMWLTERNLAALTAAAEKPYGLILCVGPTGSGKTTTLHSVLEHINRPERKIWTAEDPVEIVQPGLRQVQVKPKIGLTFATIMRSFLRADPDVIMVGEMRDAETARIGLEASLTGHLILSTLHTNSAIETVVRLLDLGMDPFNFADALLVVIAQRLVKRTCDGCRKRYQASDEELEALTRTVGEDAVAMAADATCGTVVLARGEGCERCSGTGFRGRVGIHELAVASDDLKGLIRRRAPVTDMLACASREGMLTLVQDGMYKVLKGLTTIRQVQGAALR